MANIQPCGPIESTETIQVVEDTARNVGQNILNAILLSMPGPIGSITVSGFPEGTVVRYEDVLGNQVTATAGPNGLELPFTDDDLQVLVDRLKTLEILSTPEDDEDFTLLVTVAAPNGAIQTTLALPVDVLAVADPPTCAAVSPLNLGTGEITGELNIVVDRSSDNDGSETLTIELQVTSDASGFGIGSLSVPVVFPGVTFSTLASGLYRVEAEGETPEIREALLDALLSNGIVFTARPGVTGSFPRGIIVRAISTENAGTCAIMFDLLHGWSCSYVFVYFLFAFRQWEKT